MNSAKLERLLLDISALCRRVGETRTAEAMERLASAVRAASSESDYQRAVREVLRRSAAWAVSRIWYCRLEREYYPSRMSSDGLRKSLFETAKRELH
jgi:hypothetical protein